MRFESLRKTWFKKNSCLVLIFVFAMVLFSAGFVFAENSCQSDSDCNDWNLYTYDKCINPCTESSFCSYASIRCINNNDCSFTGFFGKEFCSSNDVFKLYQTSICKNSGTIESYCEISNISKLIVDCGDSSCEFGENYCKNGNVFHSGNCLDKGCEDGYCYLNQSEKEQLVKNCRNGCENGECLNADAECYSNNDCDSDEYCHFNENGCFGQGVCIKKPEICIQIYEPVCGCDGITYGNECIMNSNGASKLHDGECEIICLKNEDCGEDSCTDFGENYCKNGKVYHSRTCHNKGCSSGSCFDNTNEDEQLVKNCRNGCENGECKETHKTSDGNKRKILIEDEVYNNETIFEAISFSNLSSIAFNQSIILENLEPKDKGISNYLLIGLIILLLLIFILLIILSSLKRD